MTAYRIKYQIRRKEMMAIPQGDWQDRKEVVVGNDDAREVIENFADAFPSHDFRLREIEVVLSIDSISYSLMDELSIDWS